MTATRTRIAVEQRPASDTRRAGLTSLGTGLVLLVAAALEASTSAARGDGDNVDESLAYLEHHAARYASVGVLLPLAAVLLIATATRAPTRTSFSAALATVAATLLALAGALRASANGALEYITSLDRDWGEGAYLVVHMAGTQGALLGGIVLTCGWALCTATRDGGDRLPTWLRLPAAVLVVPVVAPALAAAGVPAPGFAWVAYAVTMLVLLPLWLVAAGAVWLRSGRGRS